MRISTRSIRAFSLIELLMVMAVGLMLTVMAIPAFGRLARKSKVQQAADSLITAINMANMISQQMPRPEAVVTYFGDDFSSVQTKPVGYISAAKPGILPKYGNIEVWSAQTGVPQGHSAKQPYYPVGANPYAFYNAWVSFYFPLEPLSVMPYTFPEGVRLLAGQLDWTAVNATTYMFKFSNFEKSNPIGEVRRHMIATSGGKGYGQPVSDYYGGGADGWSYTDVLIFDVVTGDHVIVRAIGGFQNTSGNPAASNAASIDYKARILTNKVTHENIQIVSIRKPTGAWNGSYTTYPLVDKKNIQALVDN